MIRLLNSDAQSVFVIARFEDWLHGKQNKHTLSNVSVTYFKDQGERDYNGKTYYEALKDNRKKDNTEWIGEQSSSLFQESIANETQKELDQEFELNKMTLIDKMMFKSYLLSDDNNYKEDYKITDQNNFNEEMLKYAKNILFTKYFDVSLFSNGFTHYFSWYEDPINVKITPEMVESIKRLTKDDNYKEYIIK